MDPLIIPIVALLIPIIIVPTALGIKHAKFLREVKHAERMRAMELGRTRAEDESWSPASIIVRIVVASGEAICPNECRMPITVPIKPSKGAGKTAPMVATAAVGAARNSIPPPSRSV